MESYRGDDGNLLVPFPNKKRRMSLMKMESPFGTDLFVLTIFKSNLKNCIQNFKESLEARKIKKNLISFSERK